MSIGLLVVCLQYRSYVVSHLPKWFTFSFVFSRLFDVVGWFATLAPNNAIQAYLKAGEKVIDWCAENYVQN